MKLYTGIGSRKTPPEILRIMSDIASFLALHGWTLRSGGAEGADSAFEHGCDKGNGGKEIYLPWEGFNGNQSELCMIPTGAFVIAQKFHPNWGACSYTVKLFHARNVMQVLGLHLDIPSAFVVCWTPDGRGEGGTGQALRIARAYDITIFDLALVSKEKVYDYALSCRD